MLVTSRKKVDSFSKQKWIQSWVHEKAKKVLTLTSAYIFRDHAWSWQEDGELNLETDAWHTPHWTRNAAWTFVKESILKLLTLMGCLPNEIRTKGIMNQRMQKQKEW